MRPSVSPSVSLGVEEDDDEEVEEVGRRNSTAPAPPPHDRYPRAPLPVVRAAVVQEQRLLLWQRHENGRWRLPGGRVPLGWSLAEAAESWVKSQTGYEVIALRDPLAACATSEHIERDAVGAVRYHFVETMLLCRLKSSPDAEPVSEVAARALGGGCWLTGDEILALPPLAQTAPLERLARLALRLAERR